MDTLTIFVVDVFGGRRGFVMGLFRPGANNAHRPGDPREQPRRPSVLKKVTGMDVSEGGDEVVSIRGDRMVVDRGRFCCMTFIRIHG